MVQLKCLAEPLALLLLSALELGLVRAQSCDASAGSAYQGKYKSLGCYNDSSVSILSNAKVSTIAMTPQYCAAFCGSRGYEYGGIEFTMSVY